MRTVSTAAPSPTTYYRLAPALIARFVGLYVLLLAVVVFLATAVVALADLSPDLLLVVLAVGLVGLFVLGWWLRKRAYVLRASADGYTVRLLRRPGVRDARWSQVEDAVAAVLSGVPCVVLRLKDGGTTTIPATVLDVDKDEFVRRLQRHLQGGQGLRPL